MVFSPANYLRGLGWSGPGTSLQPDNVHARIKPILIPQKKTLGGVGKDRDTAYPWWEMVFATVAGKVKGDNTDHHRTSTGIISPLPPPKPSITASETITTTTAKTTAGGMNLSALAEAKMEIARRQLYSGFLRGKAMGGTREEAELLQEIQRKAAVSNLVVASKEEDSESDEEEEERSSKRRKVVVGETSTVSEQMKQEKVKKVKQKKVGTKDERKLLRRQAKADSIASTSTLPTPIVSDTEGSSAVESKDQRRKERREKKERKEKSKLQESSLATDSIVVDVVIDSIETVVSIEDEESVLLAAKAEQKRVKKEAKRVLKLENEDVATGIENQVDVEHKQRSKTKTKRKRTE